MATTNPRRAQHPGGRPSAGLLLGGIAVVGGGAALLLMDRGGPPPPPVSITDVTPTSGVPGGGTPVTIVGHGFDKVIGVRFGATPATSWQMVSTTEIRCVAPAGTDHTTVGVGLVLSQTTMVVKDGAWSWLSGGAPPPTITSISPTSGHAGDPVTIRGSGFVPGQTDVRFGSAQATAVNVIDSATLTCKAP